MDRDEKDVILVIDHVGLGSEFHLDREADEDDESYHRRLALFRYMFSRGNSDHKN